MGLLSALLYTASADESADHVIKECKEKLRNIDSIEKFEQFISHYKKWTSSSERPSAGFFSNNRRAKKCYDLDPALRELETIVADRHKGVCQTDYVERLVDFHDKYLTNPKQDGEKKKDGEKKPEAEDEDEVEKALGSKSSYVAWFFSIFSHQVAITCKSKLNERIADAQRHQDCSVILEKYLPPVSEFTDEDKNLEDIGKFMDQFQHVEDYMPVVKFGKSEFYYDLKVSSNVLDKINGLKSDCHSRKPYYTALFNPISLLAQIGTDVSSDEKDSGTVTKEIKLRKCWLATAQLCQGILLTNPMLAENADLVEPILIKYGTPPKQVESSGDFVEKIDYKGDTFDEVSPEVLKLIKSKKNPFVNMLRKGRETIKKFVERHVDLDAIRQSAMDRFIESLVREENGIDSKVAFGGKTYNGGQYSPTKLISDNGDTYMQFGSFFLSRKVGLAFSCIAGIALSAVFVWFSVYALMATLRPQHQLAPTDNFKGDWRELRDKRLEKIRAKFELKGIQGKMKIYSDS